MTSSADDWVVPPADGKFPVATAADPDATRSMSSDDDAGKLANILDQYLAELQAGHQPDRQQLLSEHPDLASQLESCLSGIEFIHRASTSTAKSGMPTQLGDFRIQREVGRGGMGVVYEAEQISLKRRVALKVLRFGAAADTEAMQRFQREAETVAGLHHTNIVPIFAIGCEQGVNYYAMQFIEGSSLASFNRKPEACAPNNEAASIGTHTSGLRINETTPNQVAVWGLQAAEALAHAHQRGVIHRDIKPSNLILDPDGRIWLTDFGLAKRMDDVSLSMAGAILGTPRYMSPEQASAAKNPVDHRTDIYSLGATLYELATGRPLFEADSPHAVITQILTSEPPRPRVVCPNLPRDFETIILKCLAKEPSQRYATAQALADDLRAFVEGRAIRARRATLAEQAARWFKQQKRSVGVAAATVAATIFVVIGSLIAWQMHSQAQLAYLTLETPRDGNERAEVAEVRTLNDEPVGSPFTLPTKEPVVLSAGAYRLRLSAPSKLSRDYLFDVMAGQSVKFDVGLTNETVGHPLALKSPVGVSLWSAPARRSFGILGVVLSDRDARNDSNGNSIESRLAANQSGVEPPHSKLFIGPQNPNKPTMRCVAANAQPGWKPDGTRETDVAPVWEADWRLEAPGIMSFLKLPEDKEAWKVLPAQADVAAWQQVLAWFDASWLRFGSPPKLVQPLRDLNGDGVEDAIWSAPQLTNSNTGAFGAGPLTPKAAVLIAVSGKDGQPLWWFRPQDAAGNASRIVSEPIWCGESLVSVLRSTATGEHWVEAASAPSGESLWRSGRFTVFAPGSAWLTKTFLPEGTESIVFVGGTQLVVMNAQTGVVLPGPQPATNSDSGNRLSLRPNEPILDARFADLDGDGVTEALLTVQTSERGIRDIAFSVTQGRPLWEVPSSFEVGAWHQNESHHSWPLLGDLDGDDKPEVILPGLREEGAMVSDGCRVLDGVTGELRWTRRFPRRGGFSHRKPEQFTIGPDLDGDGRREVFMASIRSEFRPRLAREGHSHHYEEHMLFVDAFSGRDGRSLWWQRVPLGLTDYAAMTGTIGEMLWWMTDEDSMTEWDDAPRGQSRRGASRHSFDGKLVIPVHRRPDTQSDGETHSIYILSAMTGRVEHQADDLAFPKLVDWNLDGLEELLVFAPDDPARFASQSHWPPAVSGRVLALRGTPPEAFRRLGPWVEEQDFDGDGIAELSRPIGGRGVDYAVQIASGRDGHITSHWKVEWPETPRSWTVGELQSFPAPLGDFDGDGLADLLSHRSAHFWDWEDDPGRIVNVGAVPLLMQAISSRTGRRAWGGGLFPLPEAFRPTDANRRSDSWLAHRGNHLMMSWFDAVDLDHDQRPELLLALRLAGERFPRPTDGSDRRHQQEFLALVDGRDGSLRWAEPFTKLTPGDQYWMTQGGRLRVDASADLNRDDTRDVVMIVPGRTPEGWWSGDIEARDGRNGQRLWGPIPLNGNWYNSDELRAPIVSDLDGDGQAEIVILESRNSGVRVLAGNTGENRWNWQGKHQPNFAVPSLVVVQSRFAAERSPAAQSSPVAPRQDSRTSNDADRANDAASTKDADSAPGNSSRGARRLRCVAVTVNETGNQWELVLLDHAGQVVERQPSGSIQIWSHDLDGDGLEELLRPGNNKITASRGLHDTLWEWSHPAEFGYGYVSRFDRTADGRVIVVAASGDSLALLDGPTGKPLGRTFKSTNTSLTENNRVVDLSHANIAASFENSRLLTRVGDGSVMLNHVVSRTVLPTDATGRYATAQRSPIAPRPESRTETGSQSSTAISKPVDRSAGLSRSDRAALDDPRLIRQLPWAPSQAEWAAGKITMLAQAGLAVVLAFVVILIPFWLIRAGVRRKELGWWRGAMIVTAIGLVAISLLAFRIAPPGAVWRDAPWLLPVAMALAALPALVWLSVSLRCLTRGDWRRLLWLLGGSLLASLGLAALALSLEGSTKPVEQHYSWHAWWFILLAGGHVVGAFLVMGRILGPGAVWLWKFGQRRFARDA